MLNKNKKNNLGVSLLEALISMAIVGIGFVAVLQITQYSINSVKTSGERTKATFFVNMFVEDSLSLRDNSTSENFTDILAVDDDRNFTSACGTQGAKDLAKTDTVGDIYKNSTSDNDPTENKSEKCIKFIEKTNSKTCAALNNNIDKTKKKFVEVKDAILDKSRIEDLAKKSGIIKR